MREFLENALGCGQTYSKALQIKSKIKFKQHASFFTWPTWPFAWPIFKDSRSFAGPIRIYTSEVSLWIVFKYSCNAISQGQSLEIVNKVTEFDNLYFSNHSYSSKEEQEDVEK